MEEVIMGVDIPKYIMEVITEVDTTEVVTEEVMGVAIMEADITEVVTMGEVTMVEGITADTIDQLNAKQ